MFLDLYESPKCAKNPKKVRFLLVLQNSINDLIFCFSSTFNPALLYPTSIFRKTSTESSNWLSNTFSDEIESIKSFYDFSVDVLTKLEINNVVFIKSKIENGYSDQQPYDCIIIEGGVNHVPNEILNQLSENGRLVAVEIKEGNVGKATIYQRYGKEFTKKYLFDAYVPVFDGFKKNQNFNF